MLILKYYSTFFLEFMYSLDMIVNETMYGFQVNELWNGINGQLQREANTYM